MVVAGQRGRGLEAVERDPRVAACDLEQRVNRVGGDRRMQVGHAALDDLPQLVAVERLEPEDAAA